MLLEDPWSYYAGGTPEVNHELMLRAYIKKYGIKEENLDKLNVALAQIAVKNHANATKNPNAQYQRSITVEQVIKARKSSRKSLGLLDFAPVSDGASALILTSAEKAKAAIDNPIYVLGITSATDYLDYPARKDLTHFEATKLAMQKALKASMVNPAELQLLELYDQSTVMEMVSLEDLGLCQEGTAWKHIYENCQNFQGCYEIKGRKIFTNTNGGLKADGNPLGATGGAQIFEVVKQLRGEAGERQIPIDSQPQYGCTLEIEGFGTKSYVSILGRNHP
jgi:acetyl-CoA C-acetyltransferase